jgi:hypothetical protein
VSSRKRPRINSCFLQTIHFELHARESQSGYPLHTRSCYLKLTCEWAALSMADFGDGLERFGEEGLGVEVLLL